ncbi:MAG TPA: aminomethyl-transferring glycine dehydrogenase subunit GcvPA [Chloroflexota bacterium]|nr:aminomethyl-transferring glycine dehydrogenase subunit GcvPA [Chloroflexota bacterium]
MNYLSATPEDRARMLREIRASSVDELFADLPEGKRRTELNLPAELSEIEVTRLLRDLSEQNYDLIHHPCFLGAGAYNHFIPSVVGHLIGRAEFYTSYTPYQPEVSQGTLQTIYEYQSLICALTGMEISNASMYDGASALAEAVIMAANVTDRSGVLVAPSVHPDFRRVMETYVQGLEISVIEGSVAASGTLDRDRVRARLDESVGSVVVQYPNFFGHLEDLAALADAAHAVGALLVVAVNPLALGLLTPPGALGADIVVGEGQPLGIPLSLGGPYLGIFATRERFIRNLPGRIVGATTDGKGQRGFVLTFQTREQHIRREKATSNICSNEALCALASTIYLSHLGKRGLRQVAELSLRNAHYLAGEISRIPGFSVAFNGPYFNEFVMRCPVRPTEVNARLLEAGIIGGYELGRDYPDLADALLFCTTELNRKADMDRLVRILGDLTPRGELAAVGETTPNGGPKHG